jgi:hypothetical protein
MRGPQDPSGSPRWTLRRAEAGVAHSQDRDGGSCISSRLQGVVGLRLRKHPAELIPTSKNRTLDHQSQQKKAIV